jgi:ATP-dependent Clp protease ATP-binding subunit ClpA
MFERFADQARNAVTLAMSEAAWRGDRRIGTEHLLLGVLHDPEIVQIVGVNADTARNAADALDRKALAAIGLDIGDLELTSGGVGSKHPPFTSGAKEVMKRMLANTTAEKARRIAPKHLLIALLERQEPDPAASLLASLGVDIRQVLRRIRHA